MARAQEMEPRAYSVSPIGTNFFVVGAGATQGSILFDPTVPITDTQADLGLATLGYGRTFNLWGRQGLAAVAVPAAWGHIEGMVMEESQRVGRSGFGDLRFKIAVNLVGPKAMRPEEFHKALRQTVMGASLTVQAPTGEYDETKLINLGTNRFALKPEVGISVPAGRWYLDAYAGVWFFATNDDFFPEDATRRQDPLWALQGHATCTFRNRVWMAINTTWYTGGSATVDSGSPSERQNNSRIGGTLSVPITARQSLKFSASTGASTRTGSDFDTYLLAWQFTWFDRPSGGPP